MTTNTSTPARIAPFPATMRPAALPYAHRVFDSGTRLLLAIRGWDSETITLDHPSFDEPQSLDRAELGETAFPVRIDGLTE